MYFRDLNLQYHKLKSRIDQAISEVLSESNFISGFQVESLEKRLASYVGRKHCISCGNGTDALSLALMALKIGPGDAVFVPDFTFFATGETVSSEGAVPIFVDIDRDTFNIDLSSLEKAIKKVIEEEKITPKAILAVDLFGQPAAYEELQEIASQYHLYLIEDAAQGFGGKTREQFACSFGDISTTSFFPAKPLGCYGDGGAVFTDNDEWAELIRSFSVHGKGEDKYDNIRIGRNSRLDTMQAAVLHVKLDVFDEELDAVNKAAQLYTALFDKSVKTPVVLSQNLSCWAQYSICLKDEEERNRLKIHLKEQGIPTMIYYTKPMHEQKAFTKESKVIDLPVSKEICKCVLSLPMHPYIRTDEIDFVASEINMFRNYTKNTWGIK